MTTTTLAGAGSTATTGHAPNVTARRVLRSEWAKFWSLRSSWITLGISLVLLVLFGTISAFVYDPSTTPGQMGGETTSSDAVSLALTGSSFAMLAIGVLGVLCSAGEYSTGLIRSTLAAVPRRLPVLWSKAVLLGLVAFVVATVGAVASFLLGGLGIDESIALSLGDDGVLRSLVGAGLYLGLVGVWGVALGVLLRSSAGGIAVLVGMMLILSGLTSLLPDSWSDTITPYLPSNAGDAVMSLQQSSDSLGPWEGLAVFACWVAVTLAAAAYRLKRTDA